MSDVLEKFKLYYEEIVDPHAYFLSRRAVRLARRGVSKLGNRLHGALARKKVHKRNSGVK